MKNVRFYLVLPLVFLSACASQEDNIKLLGDKTHVMTDENGNKWLVKRKFGDNYRLYLVKN